MFFCVFLLSRTVCCSKLYTISSRSNPALGSIWNSRRNINWKKKKEEKIKEKRKKLKVSTRIGMTYDTDRTRSTRWPHATHLPSSTDDATFSRCDTSSRTGKHSFNTPVSSSWSGSTAESSQLLLVSPVHKFSSDSLTASGVILHRDRQTDRQTDRRRLKSITLLTNVMKVRGRQNPHRCRALSLLSRLSMTSAVYTVYRSVHEEVTYRHMWSCCVWTRRRDGSTSQVYRQRYWSAHGLRASPRLAEMSQDLSAELRCARRSAQVLQVISVLYWLINDSPVWFIDMWHIQDVGA